MDYDPLIVSIRAKLSRAGVKIASVIQACEETDGNNDKFVHIDDLEIAMGRLIRSSHSNSSHDQTLEEISISKREIRQLQSYLTTSKERVDTQVQYTKLLTILQPRELKQEPEQWHDGTETLAENTTRNSKRSFGIRNTSIISSSGSNKDNYWSQQRGSVGEFLANTACVSEIKSFKKLIASLENFERESGCRITQSENGTMIIPLGPDLKATLTFSHV